MDISKNYKFSLVIMFVGLIFASPMVHATYPDLTAAPWYASFSGSDFSCTNPADDGPFSEQGSLVFSNQVGGNFDVTFTFVDEYGEEVDTGTGFFISPSTFEFTVTNTNSGVDTSTVMVRLAAIPCR